MAISNWANFFTASASAAAALAGLVIVAISVNITHILKFKQLPTRAAATVCSLVLILIVSLVSLMNGMSIHTYGLIVIFLSLITWAFNLKALIDSSSSDYKRSFGEKSLQLAVTQLGALMFIVSGILLAFHKSSGFSWLAYSILVVFVSSMVNTWVLLVEILR